MRGESWCLNTHFPAPKNMPLSAGLFAKDFPIRDWSSGKLRLEALLWTAYKAEGGIAS